MGTYPTIVTLGDVFGLKQDPEALVQGSVM